MKSIYILSLFIFTLNYSFATDYHIGPSQALTTIGSVPWGNLLAGDNIYIHWKNTAYKEKWVINAQGTSTDRISIIGISGPNGEKPIIDGDGAVTPINLDYWGESRGVIKIGGSSFPANGLPNHITIENLEIKSSHDSYQFYDDNGNLQTYSGNAAAIYVEKCANLIISNCILHDSGNGLFIGEFNGESEHILIENNYIYGNGNVGSPYEHNSYTEAIDITFQYNHYGPLRTGADGNNLKDRSAGLVVKYNWIEGGNRQLDLVEAQGSTILVNHPSYSSTHVFGNTLIEPDGDGNQQIVHYGGDSGSMSDFRKGTLYFYNNTIVSYRSGYTTLIRLSTADESAEIFNNVIYTTASGNNLALSNSDGTINLHHNWLMENWVDSHGALNGTINDAGNNTTGTNPGFEDFNNHIFTPASNSPLVDQGDVIPSGLILLYNVVSEYVKHTEFTSRAVSGVLDIGAYEFSAPASVNNNGINEVITIYPNPVNDMLYIKTSQFLKLDIYNSFGQLILSSNSSQAVNGIDIKNISNGVYFLNYIINNKSEVIKFVKQF